MRCPGYKTREGERITDPHEVGDDDFYFAKGKKDSVCKACRRTIQRRYERRYEAKVRTSKRKSMQRHRLRAYGITTERYDELVALQEGQCVICQLERPLQVDHDHASGEVRFLLCGKCNRAEGLLDGDPERAYRLARYLEVTAPDPKPTERQLDTLRLYAWLRDNAHLLTGAPRPKVVRPERRRGVTQADVVAVNRALQEVWGERWESP